MLSTWSSCFPWGNVNSSLRARARTVRSWEIGQGRLQICLVEQTDVLSCHDELGSLELRNSEAPFEALGRVRIPVEHLDQDRLRLKALGEGDGGVAQLRICKPAACQIEQVIVIILKRPGCADRPVVLRAAFGSGVPALNNV